MSNGLKLDQFKEPALSSEINTMIPKKVYIKKNFKVNGKNYEIKTSLPVGYEVKKNEEIGSIDLPVKDKFSFNISYEHFGIYAQTDGTIGELEYFFDEDDGACSFIGINSRDNLESFSKPCILKKGKTDVGNDRVGGLTFKKLDKKLLLPEEIIKVAQDAGIVDETDGQPLFTKLIEIKNSECRRIYIDAIDDQPYVSSKEVLILQYSDVIDPIVKIVKSTFNLENLSILFHNMESSNLKNKIPNCSVKTNIIGIKENYPVRHYIKNKYKYNAGIGIQALIHLARAIEDPNYKHVTTFITICGDCISEPCNIEVSIGTLVKDILESIDLCCDPKRIIMGPSITGKTITDTSVPIKADTRAIIAFSNFNTYKIMECIGCAKCCDVCPQGLVPIYRKKYQNSNDPNLREFISKNKCIQCYCCTYICPSNIELC